MRCGVTVLCTSLIASYFLLFYARKIQNYVLLAQRSAIAPQRVNVGFR